MTDNTDRPIDGRPEVAPDGGHLHEEPAPTAAVATAEPAEEGAAFRRRRDRNPLLVPVVVAAVIAALLGGALGAGIGVAAAGAGDGGAVTTSAANGSGSGIVINDPSSATVVSAVAAKAAPSVVTISVTASDGSSGTGSGIVLSADGDVLTNNHVVTLGGQTSSGTITVATSNGRLYKAKVVGTDPLNDLAVIKLQNASGLTAATFADSNDLNVGDDVVAIGAPRNLANTVTSGIVSALNRSIPIQSSAVPKGSDQSPSDGNGSESPFNFWNFGDQAPQQATANIYLSTIQTDAAINPGNSGGALLDSQGRVIGVNVAILSSGSASSDGAAGSIGLSFAIPSTIAKRIADDLIAGKEPTHGQIGLAASTDTTAVTAGVEGAQVGKVTAGGPGAKAGIGVGDVVTSVAGVPVRSFTDLAAQVRAHVGGSTVDVTYVHDGRTRTAGVTLGSISAQS